ncbi:MAG: hypothetical protein HQK87_11625 [Nitrospinae bacterium]|nr:hypothetical protein [Nitrospinota bacterium]
MFDRKVSALIVVFLLILSLTLSACAVAEKKDTGATGESNVATAESSTSGASQESKKKKIEKEQFMERLCR